MWPKQLIFLLFSIPSRGRGEWRGWATFAAAMALCWLVGCGQQGALYLPTEPAAANRATLPETLLPGNRTSPAQSLPTNTPAKPAPP